MPCHDAVVAESIRKREFGQAMFDRQVDPALPPATASKG